MIRLLHIDCLDYMKDLKDNAFDLAIVDPPYGIGENWKKDRKGRFYKNSFKYKNASIPSKKYFIELQRVSNDQIIWGANYYTDFLPPRNSWIVWDKKRDYPTQHQAEGELAWTSFSVPLRIAEFLWCGFVRCEPASGIHPHEKPVKLYEWLLTNYAKEGDRILDTHLGSGSSAIAAHNLGFDFVGMEIDKDYYDAGLKRFDLVTSQTRLVLK